MGEELVISWPESRHPQFDIFEWQLYEVGGDQILALGQTTDSSVEVPITRGGKYYAEIWWRHRKSGNWQPFHTTEVYEVGKLPEPEPPVEPEPEPLTAKFVRYASATAPEPVEIEDGELLSGGVYVGVEPSTPIDGLEFWWNDEHIRWEGAAPYMLGGDTHGEPLPFDTTKYDDGEHRIYATIHPNDGDSVEVSLRVEVDNAVVVEPEPEPEPEPPPPGEFNEPRGFEPWFRHNLATHGFPETRVGLVWMAASDVGFLQFSGASAHIERATLIDDPRFEGGKCLRVLWPANFSVGSGMFNYAMRSTDGRASTDKIAEAIKLQRWYIRQQYLLEPDDDGTWEAHWDQLRIFTGNRHLVSGTQETMFGWTLRGESNAGDWGGGHFMDRCRAYRLWGYKSPTVSSSSLASPSPGPRIGQLITQEMLFDLTVRGSNMFPKVAAPVHVKAWENGAGILDAKPEWYIGHPFMELFQNINQSGGVRPATDKYIRLGVPYISGERVVA